LAKKAKQEAEMDAGALEKQAYWDAQSSNSPDAGTGQDTEKSGFPLSSRMSIIIVIAAVLGGCGVYFFL